MTAGGAAPGSSFHARFIVGPTAVGKTAVAQALALADGCDILSVDSMLVYRGMDIGTAKPSAAERAGVRYWGIDLVEAGDPFSAADFSRAAAEACRACRADARPLLAVGGTGLYVSVLLRGLAPVPGPDHELRARWEESVRREGVGPLQEEVRRAAPALYESLSDRQNPRRLIRALEAARAGMAARPAAWKAAPAMADITGLRMEPVALRRRIERRVEAMFGQGLLDEAAALSRAGRLGGPAAQAIGYAEALAVLEGRCPAAEAKALIVRRTWQLARRQMTWFRRQVPVDWLDVEDGEQIDRTAERVRAAWRRCGPAAIVLPGSPRVG